MESNKELYEFASRYLVGGTCASMRVDKSLGQPFYVSRAEGSKVYDISGREYIDMITSHGAGLLGHGHPLVKEAIRQALDLGIACSYETAYQSQVAKKIVDIIPCAEMVRFTQSGTETTLYAIRLAREYTGKDRIIKFEGHFHGFHDYLAYNCWPPIGEGLPRVRAESGGFPAGLEEYVVVLPFNDPDALEDAVAKHGHEIGAIILEPINYNSGGIMPKTGYLEAMRELASSNNILLIFDEILSGFRTGPGCAQEYLGVAPDVCTLGKALGGGTPLSAFVGKREFMESIAPVGKAVHSGTYNGHLIPIMAANAFLDEIVRPGFYEDLLGLSEYLYSEIREIISRTGVKCWLQGIGARFCLLFGLDEEPTSYRVVATQRDVDKTYEFCAAARRNGVYFHASFHHGLSSAHTREDVDRVLEGTEAAMREIA